MGLGAAYAEGKFVERDPVEAYVWLKLASQENHSGATEMLTEVIAKMDQEQIQKALKTLKERHAQEK